MPTATTWTFFHGSRDLSRTEVFEGCCLTSQPLDALAYCRGAGVVLEVEVTLAGLNVEEIEAEVDAPWPCDLAAERAAKIASGVDAVEYRDLGADSDGREIECFRVLSDKAMAACRVLRVLSVTECADEFSL